MHPWTAGKVLCAHMLTVDEIRRAYKEFLKNTTKVNVLLALQDTAEGTEDAAVFEVCLQAILGILCKCVDLGLLRSPSAGSDEVSQKVSQWLKDFSHAFLAMLVEKVKGDFYDSSIEAILALMEVMHSVDEHDDSGHQFPNGIYQNLIHAAMSNERALLTLREAMEQYSDLRYYGYRNLARMLKEAECDATKVLLVIKGLTWKLDPSAKDAVAVSPPKPSQQESSADEVSDGSDIDYASESSESETEEQSEVNDALFYLPVKGDATPAVKTRRGHRHEFTTCWLALLTRPLDATVLLDVLSILDDQVMPGITTPTLLLDFLTSAYNTHGWQALASLWILMRHHGLDYPSFYPKLYSLLTPALNAGHFTAKHAKLLDMFLRSTHLPAYMVASFIKRLAELACYAPPYLVESFYLPLLYNLLKRHLSCQAMLQSEETQVVFANTAAISIDAASSPLYELLSLCRHYHFKLAKTVQSLFLEARILGKHLEVGLQGSYDAMVEAELAHRWSKVPPTQTIIKPALFD